MSGRQVVERDDIFAAGTQLTNDMAADVSGTACHQYFLVFHELIVHTLSPERKSVNRSDFYLTNIINTDARNTDLDRTILCTEAGQCR